MSKLGLIIITGMIVVGICVWIFDSSGGMKNTLINGYGHEKNQIENQDYTTSP